MSKELKALQALKNLTEYLTGSYRDCFEELSIIKTALKRKSELEKAFGTLSKEDEKVKKLLSLEIEKNRALEIIKEALQFEFDDKNKLIIIYRGSNQQINMHIPQQKYDLLKEVLL